jgi:hypothetical protein
VTEAAIDEARKQSDIHNQQLEQPNFICPDCNVSVKSNDKGLECESCFFWHHSYCQGISEQEYIRMQSEPDERWVCKPCEIKESNYNTELQWGNLVGEELIGQKIDDLYYNIDGMLLQFMKSYLSGREQSVVVNGAISATLPVLSGVPQGSIIGPTLFVLFINDIYSGLSHGTNILLYADDTKIWREISEEEDHNILQHDINFLMTWARTNKMKFHPDKCKVLAILKRWSPFDGILPFTRYIYSMGQSLLEYTDSEKDLGIIMTSNLNFNSQADALYGKANQKFGMLKRNCHFVNDLNKRRVLYLTLVRSIFEHCPIIWRPTSNSTIAKLAGLHYRAIKWIRNDYSVSYSLEEIYHAHCKQLNILPLKCRFDYHDLKFFHSLVHQYHPCTTLPHYLTFFSGSSRLRSSHLDHLSALNTPGLIISRRERGSRFQVR